MAIIGIGTEQDPFLVHDYDELKSCIESVTSTEKYVKLVNDIDLKDFENFEWETVKPSTSGITAELDLNNKTIQNILIKASNYLFRYVNIKNGKIKNVFGNNASGILYYGGINKTLISANVSGFSNYPFYYSTIENLSSICVQGKINYSTFYYCNINNAWILPYVTSDAKFINYGKLMNSKIGSDDILPRGYLDFGTSSTPNAVVYINSSSDFGGNVIDVDINGERLSSITSSISSTLKNAINVDNLTTSQKSNIPVNQQYTYDSIRDFDTLTNNGFVVTEVVRNVI